MKTSFALVTIASLLLAIAGCQHKQKQEVYDHWNAARAGVQGSLAAERYKLGNMEDARKAVDEAIKMDPKNAQYRILSARIHLERNELGAAESDLAIARELAPKNAEADYVEGIVRQRWQKPDEALDFYTQACEKAPGELAYYLARAEMLVQLGKPQEAIALLESKLTYFEYSGPLRDALGSLYLVQDKPEQAATSLAQAAVLSPDDATIKSRLVRAEFRAKKYHDCLSHVDQLLQDPTRVDQAELNLLKGECHLQLQQWRDARFALEAALEKDPSSLEGLLCLTKVALKTNDLTRADICVRRAVSLAPDDAQVQLAVGYVRLKQNRPNEALAAFQKAAQLTPTDPVPCCLVGLAYEKMGQKDKALQYYGQALQMSPADPLAKQLMSSAK